LYIFSTLFIKSFPLDI